MTVRVEIQNACGAPSLPSRFQFRRWAAAAVGAQRENAEISIRIVDEAESAQLNTTYRGRSGATNVLSFPAGLDPSLQLPLLGDLAICAPLIEREAQQQHKPVTAHWAHMVVHGTLHLLGYDHIEEDEAERMESLEIRILQTLNFTNPYQVAHD